MDRVARLVAHMNGLEHEKLLKARAASRTKSHQDIMAAHKEALAKAYALRTAKAAKATAKKADTSTRMAAKKADAKKKSGAKKKAGAKKARTKKLSHKAATA